MSTSGSRSGQVLELAEEFLGRYRKGQRPSLKEYIDRHPSLADEIREVFPAMAMMEKIALADDSLGGDPTGPAPVASATTLEQLGDYRLLREVGRGGMGVVYEAEQVSLGRHVALKVLPPQMLRDPKTRRRFEREARAAAKLHHTNIVPVFGVGEHDETPYYVMQFIQGQGLDAVLDELKRLRAGADPVKVGAARSDGSLDVSAADVARSLLTGRFDRRDTDPTGADDSPPTTLEVPGGGEIVASGSGVSPSHSSSTLSLPRGEARGKAKRPTYWQGVARIGAQVAEALEYAHKQGIVHRDVKPSNLLLDTLGTIWVTDFGLAKADDHQNLTHTGDILGTLRYMPPEAFEGKSDHRGDVYSLGLTLYELLGFRPAFGEKDRGRLVRQVTTEEAPPLGSINPEVPRDLETIVQKAIDRDPAHRYATAGEMAADLQRFLDDEPIQARRQTHLEQYRRWARRNPGIATLGAVLTAVLVVATAASLVVAGHMARLADDEARAARIAKLAADEAELARRHEAEQRGAAETARSQAEASAREADAQRRQSEANFGRARRAVDDFFTKVSETQLLRTPGLQPLRLELVESSLRFYEEFLKERADDPALRSELLATRLRVGKIFGELGRADQAKSAYEAALEGYESASRDRPDDLELKAGFAEATSWVALSETKAKTRLEGFRRAVAIREELLKARPGDARFKKELAAALNVLAVAQTRQDPEESFRALQRSIDLRLELADASPDDPDLQCDVAQAFNNLASRLGSTNNAIPAVAMYQQALELVRAAVRHRPLDVSLTSGLRVITTNTGRQLYALGRRDEAIRELQTTLDLLETLSRDNPAVPSFKTSYLDVAQVLRSYLVRLDRAEEATRLLDAERAVVEQLPRETSSDWLSIAGWRVTLSATVIPNSARQSAEDGRKSEEFMAQAVAALRRACELGLEDTKVFASPAFQRLNHRDDFKALVARFGTEAAAGAGSKPGPTSAGAKAARNAPAVATLTPEGRAMFRHAIGLVYTQFGRRDEAISPLTEALELREQLAKDNPENFRYRSDLASSLIGLGDLERKTGRLDAASSWWARAEPILRQATKDRPDDMGLWKDLSRLHIDLGRDDEAAADFEKILALTPRVPNDRRHSSPRSLQIRTLAASEGAFAKLLERNPGDGSLWSGRARYYLLRDRWDRAAADFARAIETAPPESQEWFEHAGLRLLAGDAAGCRAFLREILRREGGTRDPYIAHVLARACNLSAEPAVDPAEVVRLAELGASGGNYAWFFQPVGIALYRAGRYGEAIRSLERTPEAGVNVGEKKLALAMAYQRLGETKKARVLFDEGWTWVKEAQGSRVDGAVPRSTTDWVTTNVYLIEAEALILDPAFPADPFAR
jgi:serine/threonine protein kinase/Flp pilus assembly protein TadD